MGYLKQLLSQSRPLAIEAFGTFLLVLVGTSALTTLNMSGQATSAAFVLVSALAFSATFGWLIYTFNRQLIGYFNPAISLMLLLTGKLSVSKTITLILVQLASAILASIFVALLYGPQAVDAGLGSVYPATGMGPFAAMIAEMLGTIFILSMVVKISNQSNTPAKQALLLGFSLVIGQLFSIGISGGALNPVRALAPQLAAANLNNWWVYWAGPILAVLVVWLGSRWLSQSETTRGAPLPVQQPSTASRDQAKELQQKARQALESLRQQQEDEVEVPEQVNSDPSEVETVAYQPTAEPLVPSFASDDDLEPESAQPTVVAAPVEPAIKPVNAVKPAAVKFVDFDSPIDLVNKEEE